MSKHRHEYSDVSDAASHLTSWTVKRNELFPYATEDSAANESELTPFQPVYVIPHAAVNKMSQWSRLDPVDFAS